MIGDLPMHIHPACAEALLRTADQEREAELRSGSYGKGLLGALLGGLIGAALWALILYLGYIASVAGLVIGLLAELFYEKFGGKNGKGKIPILLLAVVFGVVLGTIAGRRPAGRIHDLQRRSVRRLQRHLPAASGQLFL